MKVGERSVRGGAWGMRGIQSLLVITSIISLFPNVLSQFIQCLLSLTLCKREGAKGRGPRSYVRKNSAVYVLILIVTLLRSSLSSTAVFHQYLPGGHLIHVAV